MITIIGKRFVQAFLAFAILSVTFALTCRATGVYWNFTGSSPRGAYIGRSFKTLRPAAAGNAYALFCPDQRWPALRNNPNYRYPGTCDDGLTALIKPIAAWPGDTIVLGPDGISINGRPLPNTAVLSKDSHGNGLHHYPFGTYRVRPAELWIISNHSARSYDSRYYGPIPVSCVRAWLRPLAIERD